MVNAQIIADIKLMAANGGMTPAQMLWALGLLLVAVLVVVINDWTKPKKARTKPVETIPGSAINLTIGIVVTIAIIGIFYFGRGVPALRWLVPTVLVSIPILIWLFLLRRLIWLYLKSAVTGRLPRVVMRKSDGSLEIRCTRCSKKIPVMQAATGEIAFECPHCGEKATWESKPKL